MLLIALLVAMAAACTSAGSGSSGTSVRMVPATATAGTGASDAKLCGTPPCMRFISRSDTKTIARTVANHPLASTIVVHLVGTILCGGVLCLLGEGAGLAYIGSQAKAAVAAHECLRVSILPAGRQWQLVGVAPSDQSPYCTD